MQKGNNIVFWINPEIFIFDIDKLIKKYNNKIKFSPAKEPYVTYKLDNSCEVLQETINFLQN